MNLKYPLLLGSGSPRRKDLLTSAALHFQTEVLKTEESFPESTPIEKVAEFIALNKIKSYREQFSNHTILCADTIVVFKDKILGKPSNYTEAINMLKLLSGNKHLVFTGVAIESPEKNVCFSTSTIVEFYHLTDFEIKNYVNTDLAADKAGAYGIQEWIGLIGIKSIKGDYNNVVGLPISHVYQVLKEEFS